MKTTCAFIIAAALGLTACGAKNDLTADQAASAWQALTESQDQYEQRGENDDIADCAQGGRIKGLARSTERYHARRGESYTYQLLSCQNRDIVFNGSITHDNSAATRAGANQGYAGAIFVGGSLHGTCQLSVFEAKSTFCGFDIEELVRIIYEREGATQIGGPVAVADDVLPTVDVEDVPET